MSLDVFEKALNAGFIQATDYVEIWQSNLDYLRRRVDFSKGKSICFLFCPITELFLHSQVLFHSHSWYQMSESDLLLMDLLIISEWSRELDELRAAFARSLDYLKQDVEESKYLIWFYEVWEQTCSRKIHLTTVSLLLRVQWKWRSVLHNNADLGKDRGEETLHRCICPSSIN